MKAAMRSHLLAAATVLAALGLSFPAAGGLYTFNSGPLDQEIPDNSNSGLAYSFTVNSAATSLSDISVTLNVSGGWNGDLYSYISHGSQTAILLNRIGTTATDPVGSGSSGFNITLNLGSANDIHTAMGTVGDPITGTDFSADGRTLFSDSSRPGTLDLFRNMDPNGTWTIFFADQSPTYTSTLNSWSVEISPVPEPTTVALSIFGVIVGVAALVRAKLKRGAAPQPSGARPPF